MSAYKIPAHYRGCFRAVDITTPGSDLLYVAERVAEDAFAAGRADALEAMEALARSIEAGTERFMADYQKSASGLSTRMSGEAAALIVAERAQVVAGIRKAARAEVSA